MPVTDTAIRNAKPQNIAYKLNDALGLYLLVSPGGSKRWYLRYSFDGRDSRLALGSYPAVSLAEAREKRDLNRKLIESGINPAENRRQEKLRREGKKDFELIAREWHASRQKWSPDYSLRVLRSLEMYIFPEIGNRDIVTLRTRDFIPILKAVEKKGYTEVALRLQQRISGIMRYAVQMGLIDYNPALDLTGTISPQPSQHYPALELTEISELLTRIHRYPGRPLTRMAMLLTLLVFVRSSELRLARWQEIDFENAVWIIPAKRQPIEHIRFSHRGAKMHTSHTVPLSRQAIRLLREIKTLTGSEKLIFPGDHDPQKPISENTINSGLRRIGYDTKSEICGHGFRTMACSALVESGLWSKDAIERQMSHQERSNVRAAYIHKASMMEERQAMMQWWADYLDASLKEPRHPWLYAGQPQDTQPTLAIPVSAEEDFNLAAYTRISRHHPRRAINPAGNSNSGAHKRRRMGNTRRYLTDKAG